MNCQDFHQQLDDRLDGRLAPPAVAAMNRHAADCRDCAISLAHATALQRRLRELPAPALTPDFARRAFAAAHQAQQDTRRTARRNALRFVLAASVAVLAICIAFVPRQPSAINQKVAAAPTPSAQRVVQVSSGQVQPVRLRFNSPQALSNVTMRVSLPAGVELQDYPGQRELSWQTDLQSGANVLELPLFVRGNGGVLTASLQLGDELKQFSVVLQTTPATGAFRMDPASRIAAARDAARIDMEDLNHA